MKEELMTHYPRGGGGRIIQIEGIDSQTDWEFSNGVHLTERNDRPCYVFDGNGVVDYIKIPYSTKYPNLLYDNCELILEYELITSTGRFLPFAKNIAIAGYGGFLFLEESNRLLGYVNKITSYGEQFIPIGTHYSVPGQITSYRYQLDDSGCVLDLNGDRVSTITSVNRQLNTTSLLIGNCFASLDENPALGNIYTGRPANWVLYKLSLNYL